MFVRLIVGSVLFCGLVVAEAGALTDPAGARVFKGKTGQGYRIKFAVKERGFKILRFEADLRCRDGSTLTLAESGFLWTGVGRAGSFRDRVSRRSIVANDTDMERRPG